MSAGSSSSAPFVFAPTGSWDGDDGSWSTFHIAVGTPPQSFHILPSTTGAEIWVPYPPGCEGSAESVSDCGLLRGVEDINGVPSRGFETNESSTWELIGIYDLPTEQNLWGSSGNDGLYGHDTLSLWEASNDTKVPLANQTIAAVVTENVWLGSLGVGTAMANYTVETSDTLSPLDSMRNQSLIPSRSFGYTAGASYTNTLGSLVFGGYDLARFTPSNLSLPVGGFEGQNLPLGVRSIIVENLSEGTVSLLPNGVPITTIIDSTVSQLWLPQSVCDLFAQSFGLTLEPQTGLYLVNTTSHRKLKETNPSITFTLGSPTSSTPTTNIILPYAAFDLQAGFPIFSSNTNYFPIRVAANESQQVLGRAFLQEAYVFVDWENQNFTIGQAIHQDKVTDIITVSASSGTTDSKPLSTGLIAGVVVLVIAVVISIIGLGIFFFLRTRRRRKQNSKDVVHASELQNSSSTIHEKDESETRHEVAASQITELPSNTPASQHELVGTMTTTELSADGVVSELESLGCSTLDSTEKSWEVYELA